MSAVPVVIACTAAWATGTVISRKLRHESDPVERLAVGALIGAVSLLSSGLLLTLLGLFRGTLLCAGQLGILAILAASTRRLSVGAARDGRAAAATLLVLALLAPLTLYYATPVFDTRLEARDPGVYRLAALRLAREGSVAYRDPAIVDLSPRSREYFFPGGSTLSPARSMGFYFLDRDRGLVTPQFMPGMMVWLGVGALAGGHAGATAAIVLLAYLVGAAMFVLGRRLLGSWPPALLASVWLTASLPQSWFARYGTAEILAQLLLLLGCLLLLEHRHTHSVAAGVLGGWSLGLLPVVKIELFVIIVPVAVLLVADCATGRYRRPHWWSFWIGSLAGLLVFFGLAWSISRPYVHDVLLNPGWTLEAFTLATAGGIVALVGARVAAPRVPRRWRRWLRRFLEMGHPAGVAARWLLAALLAGLAGYAYWIRPLADGWDSHNLVILGWAASEIGLGLAIAGLVSWTLSREDTRWSGAILVLLVPLTLMVLWRKQIRPELLWAYRRYLPVVLPMCFLSAAYALGRLQAVGRDRAPGVGSSWPGRAALVAAAGMALAVTAMVAVRTEPYESQRELPGSGAMIRDLAGALPPDAVVLFEPRTRRGLLRLEGAIEHVMDRPVLRLVSPTIDRDRFRDLLLSQRRSGRSVYLMTTGYLESPGWLTAEPVESFFFETERLEERFEELPREVERVAIIAKLYRIRGEDGLPALAGELDVGGWDDLYLDGTRVYQTEGRPGQVSYRWISEEGGFWLPGLTGADRWLRLTLAGGLVSTPVVVSLDGREIGRVDVRRGWRDYDLPIPRDWEPGQAQAPHLVLRSQETFLAREVGSSEDRRRLGVAVDRIRWGPSR